jgi:hypothetical protein
VTARHSWPLALAHAWLPKRAGKTKTVAVARASLPFWRPCEARDHCDPPAVRAGRWRREAEARAVSPCGASDQLAFCMRGTR